MEERAQLVHRHADRPLEADVEVLAHVRRVERAEGDLVGLAAMAQPVDHRLQGRGLALGLEGPQAADQQQPRRIATSGQEGDEVEARRIAPVKVLEPEDDRALGGKHLERMGDLAQHALRRGVGDSDVRHTCRGALL